MCAEDSTKAGCSAWLAHPTVAEDLARTVRQVLDYETDAPASPNEALLGFKTCPGCESDTVRATLRVGGIQYYCCKTCGFCWRAETLTKV
jgi:transposase-like protein